MKTRKDVDACECVTDHGMKECLGKKDNYNPHIKDSACTCIDEHYCGKKPQHTPTPWRLDKENPDLVRDEKDGFLVTKVTGANDLESHANAEFIVRAVNSHEEMLIALRSVRNEFRAYVLNDPKNLETANGSRILAQIDRAIAKAERNGE